MKYLCKAMRIEIIVSLPSWECGLKFIRSIRCAIFHDVTPFVGVWIEICRRLLIATETNVTPFVGVWIEIEIVDVILQRVHVTPFVGVWIEMRLLRTLRNL